MEQTKFFVCEASGETRGATAVIDTLFTEDAIASFLCVTPQQLSRIRKAVTFSEK